MRLVPNLVCLTALSATALGCTAILGEPNDDADGTTNHPGMLPSGSSLTNEQAFDCKGEPEPTITARIWRLTPEQLRASLAAVAKGRDAAAAGEPSGYQHGPTLLDDKGTSRFTRDASRDSMTDVEFSQLWTASAQLAPQMLASIEASEGSCLEDGSGDDQCVKDTIDQLGELLFRRPIDDGERQQYFDEYKTLKSALGQNEALQTVARSLFLAPQALFRTELGDEEAPTEPVRLSDYELATSLSFFLTNAPPDDELWQAAQDGLDDATLADQADRLLAKLSQSAPAVAFIEEYFHIEKATAVPKDNEEFPFHEPEKLVDDTRAWIEYVYDEHGTSDFFDGLMTETKVFAQKKTQKNYGLNDVETNEPTAYDAPGSERGGIMTQPSFLAAFSSMEENHPVQRGAFVSEDLLCREIPPLPIDEIPPLPDLGEDATLRDRLQMHSQGTCAGCHQLMDPIGLGLEDYDHVGRYRTEESGKPVDASGELTDAGPEANGAFEGGVELGQRLAASSVADACFVRHGFRYWLGTSETASDACTLVDARDSLRGEGSMRAFLRALVTSPAFTHRLPARD